MQYSKPEDRSASIEVRSKSTSRANSKFFQFIFDTKIILEMQPLSQTEKSKNNSKSKNETFSALSDQEKNKVNNNLEQHNDNVHQSISDRKSNQNNEEKVVLDIDSICKHKIKNFTI